MNTRLMTRSAAALVTLALFGAGCQTSGPAANATSPAAVSAADSDRAALAKLVGAWDFDGWWKAAGQPENKVQGRAAATLENKYFLLMDVQTAPGSTGGRLGGKSGSFLFASEPGIGLTVTAWGDASPSITRLVGHASSGGTVLTFAPAHTQDRNVRLVIRIESDTRWTAEVTNPAAEGDGALASYTFTRSK